ncbi:RxLR effector protein [Phytophthora megakarya]|uniref:RxLR effector protein n=1 Tax=Phytophthora megakarya TaxID=4795 RepID=A0A225V8S5_9STRA|nr:RxLR effector protein [Phytophthora megakarya]
MPPSIRITFSIFSVVLIMTTHCVSSVVLNHEQAAETIKFPRQDRYFDAENKAADTMRLLRGGDIVVNEVTNKDERGYIADKLVTIPAVKLSLKFALRQRDSPDKVLQEFKLFGLPLKEDILLLWLGYVQKYRTKMGVSQADNAYVVKTLKEFIPTSQLPVVFKAMEKKPNLRSFEKDLRKVASAEV